MFSPKSPHVITLYVCGAQPHNVLSAFHNLRLSWKWTPFIKANKKYSNVEWENNVGTNEFCNQNYFIWHALTSRYLYSASMPWGSCNLITFRFTVPLLPSQRAEWDAWFNQHDVSVSRRKPVHPPLSLLLGSRAKRKGLNTWLLSIKFAGFEK
jgi:hypothetical protein